MTENEDNMTEKEMAMMESAMFNDAANYFSERTLMDTPLVRRFFEEGYKRGYQAREILYEKEKLEAQTKC